MEKNMEQMIAVCKEAGFPQADEELVKKMLDCDYLTINHANRTLGGHDVIWYYDGDHEAAYDCVEERFLTAEEIAAEFE